IETVSKVFTRQTPNSPFSVTYAEIASTTNTMTDFRLPPPMRISVLLVQPEASVMPTPNSKPPTRFDSHRKFGLVYSDLCVSTTPCVCIAHTPSIATAIASSHMRMRVQSPMWTMSETAPIVQKFVLLPTNPNTAPRAKPSHAISVAEGSSASIGKDYRENLS